MSRRTAKQSKIPGVKHQNAIRAQEKCGFRVARQGKHTTMTDGMRIAAAGATAHGGFEHGFARATLGGYLDRSRLRQAARERISG